jgi:hypothetical protein
VDVSFIVGTMVWFFLLYFAALNTAYLLLNLLAYPALRRRLTLLPLEDLPPVHPDLVLPVSIIISARDCASTIVDRIQAARQLYYPEYEIVVVNDGSRDATLTCCARPSRSKRFPRCTGGGSRRCPCARSTTRAPIPTCAWWTRSAAARRTRSTSASTPRASAVLRT